MKTKIKDAQYLMNRAEQLLNASGDMLKKYCDKRGIKIYKFLENLIQEKCKEKKDVYGEN